MHRAGLGPLVGPGLGPLVGPGLGPLVGQRRCQPSRRDAVGDDVTEPAQERHAWWLSTLPGLVPAAMALATNRVARALDVAWEAPR